METYKNYTTIIPADKHLKKLLKEGIARADILQYRFCANNTTVRDAPKISRNVLIAGLLEQQQKKHAESPQLVGTENETNDNDELSLSDEDSNCDMEDTAFPPAEHDDEGVKGDDIFYENEEENNETNFISEEWAWDNWVAIDDDEDIPGSPDVDPYNGGHGLKEGVADSFETVLACIFNTTAMDRDFFKRLAAQSNKYARAAMTRNNTRLYLGHKWENISVGDMVRFYGIMLRISMSPRKMGGYASYFQNYVFSQVQTNSLHISPRSNCH